VKLLFWKRGLAPKPKSAEPLEPALEKARAAGNRKIEFALLAHIVCDELHKASSHYQRALDLAFDELEPLTDEYLGRMPADAVARIEGFTTRLNEAAEAMDGCLAEINEVAAKTRSAI